MATLKDIARHSGITISSVSDILNNRPGSRYSEATRKKVKQAAVELGYDRNRLVQGMIRGRTQLIGIIVPDLGNPFYNAFLQYASPILHEAGYNLLIEEAPAEATAATEIKALQTLIEFRVDGILAGLIHGGAHAATLKKLSKRGTAVAGIGLPTEGDTPLADNVGITFEQGLAAACQQLVESGRKRFAFLGNFPWDSKLGQRWELLQANLLKHGLSGQSFANISCLHNMPSARDTFLAYLEKTPIPERPDALFTLNDNLAIGACRGAADAGLRVPEDIAIVGFDNTPLGALQVPSITTIGVDLKQMASTAAHQLLDRLNQPGKPYETTILEAQFIRRETS
jgi:DNA-binding LacI/PurR family transcriptional regulator